MPFKDKKYNPIGKFAREDRRLTVPEVVEALKISNIHISKQTLYNYENGTSDMTASIMLALADLYNCTLNDLLDPIAQFTLPIHIPTYETYGYNELHDLYPINKMKFQYDFKKNSFDDLDFMAHAIFEFDDIDTGFLKDTRVIYRKKEAFKFKISSSYNYYLIVISETLNGEKFTKTFFTKAKFVHNSVTPRIVQYFYQGQVIHCAEKSFKDMVEGIVVKVIYDKPMTKIEGAFFY